MSTRGLVRRAMDPRSTVSLPLWAGTLGSPLLFGAEILAGDALFELGCSPGFRKPEIYGLPLKFWGVLLVSLLLAADILAGLLAYHAYRRLRAEAAATNATMEGRARSMAIAGMASAFIYGVALVYGLFPFFFFRACSVSI